VIRRALKKLEAAGEMKNYRLLLDQYQYEGLETCAVDGLCATACPVDINTGDLVKRLRKENHSPVANKMALLVARNFKVIEWAARAALKTGFFLNRIFGRKTMARITRGLKKIVSAMPLWKEQILYPPDLSAIRSKKATYNAGTINTVVYFPACITRMLGTYEGKKKNGMETFLSICNKTGISVIIPKNTSGSCCSQIFSSKGFRDAYIFTANDIVERLWVNSLEGKLPIIIDVSSCAYTLHNIRPVLEEQNKRRFDRLMILDSVDFLHDMVLPLAKANRRKSDIVLHPVCSLEKMKTEHKLVKIAGHFAHKVTVPKYAGCCGMAGDRGFLYPELTASATSHEAGEVRGKGYDGYYSSTKTCEMALSEAVKKNYESILYLVDEGLQEVVDAEPAVPQK
jgi:D-lactate dehydrogenase